MYRVLLRNDSAGNVELGPFRRHLACGVAHRGIGAEATHEAIVVGAELGDVVERVVGERGSA